MKRKALSDSEDSYVEVEAADINKKSAIIAEKDLREQQVINIQILIKFICGEKIECSASQLRSVTKSIKSLKFNNLPIRKETRIKEHLRVP